MVVQGSESRGEMPTVEATHAEPGASSLSTMLWARSVAVVGASPRPNSLGKRVMSELVSHGYGGRVVPITPSHTEVAGIATLPLLTELTHPVDLAILAVADSRLEEQMEMAISASIPSVTMFSPCQGLARDGSPLRERLARLAAEAGIAVCGPNGMGFVNLLNGLRATGFYQPPHLEPGGVSFLSHSGSLFSAMLHNRRSLRFNLVVSTGQELATTMDQYLDHVLGVDSTRVVGLFMETIRHPERMAAALRLAGERDIPVVALKVGRTVRAREAAATHSGALAGDDGAFDAFFDFYGVHRVDTMDEMADTLEIFTSRLRAGPGRLGAVHDSGGERSLLLDTAHAAGVPLAVIGPAARDRLATVLEPGLEPDNPVDAWGTGHGHEQIFETALRALAEDPAVGVVAFCVDLTAEEDPADGYVPLIARIHSDLEVPLVVMGNLISGIDPEQATELRRAGVPVLEGTLSGLRAIRHLLNHTDNAASPAAAPVSPVTEEVRRRWRTTLREGRDLSETESLELVADYGIPVVAHSAATSSDAAVAAAEKLGWPVALKTAGTAHKSDVRGVILGLATPSDVREGYGELSTRLGPDVTVQRMAGPGIEMMVGLAFDDQFGPLVLVGAGGTLVEILSDRRLALPPVDTARAERLIASLRVAPLLGGVRGSPPSDLASLARAMAAMSLLASDLGDLLSGVDVNPLIVSPTGVVAVDALVTVARS
ncbi:acetate--CoA ligase family protein [soil metagenome]